MNGQRGLVPSNFVEKVADESEMSTMMNGTGDLIGKITIGFISTGASVIVFLFPNLFECLQRVTQRR